jgi:predicted Zn-ribbon and HTH transcriptional regulator
MAEITLKGYKCERCGHVWVPREHERPRVCPKCKSAYWDKARKLGKK